MSLAFSSLEKISNFFPRRFSSKFAHPRYNRRSRLLVSNEKTNSIIPRLEPLTSTLVCFVVICKITEATASSTFSVFIRRGYLLRRPPRRPALFIIQHITCTRYQVSYSASRIPYSYDVRRIHPFCLSGYLYILRNTHQVLFAMLLFGMFVTRNSGGVASEKESHILHSFRDGANVWHTDVCIVCELA